MHNLDVISLYETLAMLSAQMLHAATMRDWNQLVALESRIGAHLAQLQQHPYPPTVDVAMRARKLALLQRILDCDRAIRALTEPWSEVLADLANGRIDGSKH